MSLAKQIGKHLHSLLAVHGLTYVDISSRLASWLLTLTPPTPPPHPAPTQAGVAVRSGHLCTQPVHRHLGIASSVRASPYIYNSHADVDAFIDALKDSIAFFTEMGM